MTALAGAVAVVTGAASGIGEGIAREFAARGARVVVADLDLAAAEAVAASLGGLAVRTDVSSRGDLEHLAAATLEHFGRVDVLVNNAGVGPQALVQEMTERDWRWLVDVNLWSVLHGVGVFLPLLDADGSPGHLVNVSSMSAIDPMSPLGGYAVTKAGVLALGEALRGELAAAGRPIGVSTVLPGPTRTAIADSLRHRPDDSAGALRSIAIDPPAELWRTPAEVAVMIADAVEADEEYVVTHPELQGRFEDRTARRRAAFERAAQASPRTSRIVASAMRNDSSAAGTPQ
jgi:Short-chain alcohol dehydrogenase of unknown specificity